MPPQCQERTSRADRRQLTSLPKIDHLGHFAGQEPSRRVEPAGTLVPRNDLWEGTMKLTHRRQFLHLAAGAAALPVVSRFAWAQVYPSRPVRIIVGFPPGGQNDIHARLVAQLLSERLRQQFIVENRHGAGGNIGTEAVVKSHPDGYTLLLAGSNDSWSAALYDNLRFNFLRDIAPVASIDQGAGILVVHPAFPAKTVPELIAYAKANPGKVTVASSGIGAGPHI